MVCILLLRTIKLVVIKQCLVLCDYWCLRVSKYDCLVA